MVMAAWQTLSTDEQPSFIADFANIWRAADKVVYSKTLKATSTPRTRIEQHFEPAAVQRLKASAAQASICGGCRLGLSAARVGARVVHEDPSDGICLCIHRREDQETWRLAREDTRESARNHTRR